MKFSELSDSIVSQTKEKPAWNAFLVGIIQGNRTVV